MIGTHRWLKLTLLLLLLGVVAGCRSMTTSQMAATTPQFDPVRYFSGRTHSWGVIENRRGDPTSQFTAEMLGTRDGDELKIEQRFTFAGERNQVRYWRIRRIDAQHFEATANDVVGVSRGEAWGNTFRWSYTVEGERAGFIDDLRYDLRMYLMQDGQTLINRVTVSKFGIVVARTTEYFRKV